MYNTSDLGDVVKKNLTFDEIKKVMKENNIPPEFVALVVFVTINTFNGGSVRYEGLLEFFKKDE